MAQIQTLERVSTEHHDPQERKKAWIRLVDLMAIRTVAASVNGVRKRTLQRCMEYWWSHFWSGKVQKEDCAVFQGIFPERVANLGSQFQELLIEVSEEEVQGLRAEFRGLELDRHPQYYIDEGKVFIFESRASRSKFVSTWIAMEGKDDPKSEPIKTTCSWGHLNLLLAEECLRQGTSQLLHLGTDGQSSPYTLRRVIQAIFHGLMSLDVDRADFSEKDISASIFDVKDDYFETARLDEAVHELSVPATRGFRRPVLPPDASKRYRYLYVFLYRRVVEGGEWRFARSFGRSDVRLDLLTLFVQPQFGWRMLTESFGIQEMKPLDSLDPESVALPLRRSPDRAWWGDLFEALGRSGCDLGTPRGMEATKRALAELPKNHPQSRLLPQSQDSLRISAGKLHVDLLLKQGKLTKAETKVEDAETNAEDSCWDELTGLQIDRSAFDRFRIHVLGIVNNAPWDSSEDTEGRALTSSLHVACERFLRLLKKNTPSSSIVRGNASAFLFRFGEILYRKAQQKAPSDVEASKVQAGELAYAFAVCWVADGLRSESGILSDRGLDWPLAGARSMRYYIRICLDLAQLLTETSKGRLRHLTNQLLETAQTRIGMYTRHHPFKREHANILTLQVNRIRAWAHVDFERQQPVAGDDSEARARDAQAYEQVWKILVSCWQLLEDAEAHLLSLGYQSGHVRRIYLERIDTALRMGMLEVRYRTLPSNSVSRERLQEVTGHLELAAYLLFGLKALSANSDYWTKIIQRKEEMLGDLLKQWKSISLRIPALDASKPARVRRARPGRPRRRQEPPQPPAAET